MSQRMLWEDDNPVILPPGPGQVVSTPDEMPDAWLWSGRYQNQNIARFTMTAVRTTLGHPRFRLGYEIAASMQELAPSRAMFRMTDDEEFQRAYLAKLQATGFEEIIGRLRALYEATGRPLILLCFERAGEGCHRHQLAAWLSEHDLTVPELRE